MGFPAEVIIAVNRLTRQKEETYAAFIEGLADNLIAREVKKADIAHNLRRPRLEGCDHLHARYNKALEYLNNQRD
jgi:hypothetical protein